MEILNLNVADLIPYENNPRLNGDAVQYVAESIRNFGFKIPIIIDKDNVIVAGHTRLKAAIELDIKQVPCIRADDLTEEQVKAFRLADNKVGEIAEWDYEQLQKELAEITDIEMQDLGFAAVEGRDFDSFFTDYEPEPKPPKMVVCPHCGEKFERKK